MTLTLDALPKGYELAPSTFELTPEWVEEYAAAVEDGLDGRLVPPMAIAALAVRSLLESASLPAGAIHVGQELAFLRPLQVGARLSTSARVVSRGERQGWLLMSIDLSVEDEDRRPVMKGRATVTMPASGGRSLA